MNLARPQRTDGSWSGEQRRTALRSGPAQTLTDLARVLQHEDTARGTLAKGILMERFKIGPDAAFRLLVTASQRKNLKVHHSPSR